jgi:sulfur-oxidizing protein SoxB
MVRVGGLRYAIDPRASRGQRISDLRLGDAALDPAKRYRVAGWAPVAEGAQGEPVWDVVAKWLKAKKKLAPLTPNEPKLIGMQGNPGMGG